MPERPRIFYRGEDPSYDGPRIRTGDDNWDRCLFVSSDREKAAFYCPIITVWEAKPEARILYEGSREFRSVAKGLFRPGTKMLPSCSEVVRRAEEQGYDAVWFKRQGDLGTAVMNPDAFAPRPERTLGEEGPAEECDVPPRMGP